MYNLRPRTVDKQNGHGQSEVNPVSKQPPTTSTMAEKEPPLNGKVGSNPEKTHKMIYITFVALIIDLLSFTMILPLFHLCWIFYDKHDGAG